MFALCLTSLKLETLASGLSIPNHLAFARDGSLFFTDSGEFRKVNGRIYQIDRKSQMILALVVNALEASSDGDVVSVSTS